MAFIAMGLFRYTGILGIWPSAMILWMRYKSICTRPTANDGKRRHKHDATAPGGFGDNLRQFGFRVALRMQPVAIGGFAHQHIGFLDGLRRAYDHIILPPHIAAEHHRAVASPVMDVNAGRSQDMPGRGKVTSIPFTGSKRS